MPPVSSSGNYEYKHLYEHFFSTIKNTKDGITLDNNEVSDTDVINYFYKKLVGLAELNCLLPEQITYLFSNCTVDIIKIALSYISIATLWQKYTVNSLI